MKYFRSELNINTSTIGKYLIPVDYMGIDFGTCSIQIDGYLVSGDFSLIEHIPDDFELQYQFIGGILMKIFIIVNGV